MVPAPGRAYGRAYGPAACRETCCTSAHDADAIIVGAGLAGLVAAAELIEAGKTIIILDQEPEQSLGGQAFWSLGGMFLVDSPEQRRMGIRDSHALALQDWLGTAAFDRAEDHWPRRWAEAYVAFAAGEKRAWLRERGLRLLPRGRLGRARRRQRHRARQFGAALSSHLGHRARRARALRRPGARRRTARARHLQVPPPRQRTHPGRAAAVDGVRGDILAPSHVERGRKSSRDVVGAFELYGAGGHRYVRRHRRRSRAGAAELAAAPGAAASAHDLWRARSCRRPHAGDRRGRRRQRHQPRPHVALCRRHQELESDLDRSRHPHLARPVVALARRARQPAAGAALSGLRYARHAQTYRPDRLRSFLVRADATHHREGVRALRLGTESGIRQLAADHPARAQGHSRLRSGPSWRKARTSSSNAICRRWSGA